MKTSLCLVHSTACKLAIYYCNKATSVRRTDVTQKFVQSTLDPTMSKTVLSRIVILASAITLAPAMEMANQDPGMNKYNSECLIALRYIYWVAG